MVDKREIERMLKAEASGGQAISREEVKRCFGWGNSKADQMLAGLTGVTSYRKKYYSIKEVAANIAVYVR